MGKEELHKHRVNIARRNSLMDSDVGNRIEKQRDVAINNRELQRQYQRDYALTVALMLSRYGNCQKMRECTTHMHPDNFEQYSRQVVEKCSIGWGR